MADTSTTHQSRYKKRDLITSGIVGLIAFLLAYAAANFIASESARMVMSQQIEQEIEASGWNKDMTRSDVQSMANAMDANLRSDTPLKNRFYFLTDEAHNKIAGNFDTWPESAPPYPAWRRINGADAGFDDQKIYARIFRIKVDGADKPFTALVGLHQPNLKPIFNRVWAALLAIGVLCAAAGAMIAHQLRDQDAK